MSETFLQRMDQAGRLALPFLSTLACTLLGSLVWPLPYIGSVAPPLALMAIYFWSLHRPDLFRPGMVFVIGILNDLIHSLPLGLSALIFVAAHQVIFKQRRFVVGHSFFMTWAGFTLTALSVLFLQWGLFSIVHWQVIPVTPILTQIGFAMTLFPPLCWVFIALQRVTLAHDGR